MCVCGCVGGKDVCVDVFGGGGGVRCGYNLGMSSLMEAILKNQLRHVSLPDSGTCSEVKSSVTMTTKKQTSKSLFRALVCTRKDDCLGGMEECWLQLATCDLQEAPNQLHKSQ